MRSTERKKKDERFVETHIFDFFKLLFYEAAS